MKEATAAADVSRGLTAGVYAWIASREHLVGHGLNSSLRPAASDTGDDDAKEKQGVKHMVRVMMHA